MRRSFRVTPLLLGLSLAAACGDGPTDTTGDPLTEAEVSELAAEIFADLGVYFSGNFEPQRTALLPAGLSLNLVAVPINVTIDESGPCGGGGTAAINGSVSGDIDQESGAGNLEFDITQSFTGCEVVGETHTYVVTGQPNIRLTGQMESDGGESFSGTFTLVGGFSFTVEDGREGTCGLDVTTTINVTGQNFSVSASGTMCGITVNNEIVFGEG